MDSISNNAAETQHVIGPASNEITPPLSDRHPRDLSDADLLMIEVVQEPTAQRILSTDDAEHETYRRAVTALVATPESQVTGERMKAAHDEPATCSRCRGSAKAFVRGVGGEWLCPACLDQAGDMHEARNRPAVFETT